MTGRSFAVDRFTDVGVRDNERTWSLPRKLDADGHIHFDGLPV